MVGSSSNNNRIQIFSFQAIKTLSAVDGGAIILPNENLVNRARLLRWYGIPRPPHRGVDFRLEDDIPEWGYKFHMNDVNATIGIENLKGIDQRINQARDNAKYYRDNLPKELLLPQDYETSSFWLYPIRLPEGVVKEKFIRYWNDAGIMVSQVHARNDKNSCTFEFVKQTTELPNLDLLTRSFVCIPVGHWITRHNLIFIIETIKDFF